MGFWLDSTKVWCTYSSKLMWLKHEQQVGKGLRSELRGPHECRNYASGRKRSCLNYTNNGVLSYYIGCKSSQGNRNAHLLHVNNALEPYTCSYIQCERPHSGQSQCANCMGLLGWTIQLHLLHVVHMVV